MIKEDSIVLDLEFSTSVDGDDKFQEILQLGAVRIAGDDIGDSFNAIVLPALDHIGSEHRLNQMKEILKSDSVVRGTFEEVLSAYLDWMGTEVHETFVWGGSDFYDIVQNAERLCSQATRVKLGPHLTRFLDLFMIYQYSFREQPQRLKNMVNSYGMEFSGTQHNALDDATNTARLLLQMDNHMKGYLTKNYLDTSFLTTKPWLRFIDDRTNPKFKDFAKNVLEKSFSIGFFSSEKHVVMERFVLTVPFSDHYLRSLKKREVKEYLEKTRLYPPAMPYFPVIERMLLTVVNVAVVNGFVDFSEEEELEQKRNKRLFKKVEGGKKLWDNSEKLFGQNWNNQYYKYICEIAFFTGLSFGSIVTLKGTDVHAELEMVYGYPWIDGAKKQSESLGRFLEQAADQNWLFSPDGISYPNHYQVEGLLKKKCRELGIDNKTDFSKLRICNEKIRALKNADKPA